jgi:hypothetical protein
MTIRLVPLRLTISLFVAADAERTWEAFAAIGLSHEELGQLNGWNTRTPESAMWEQRHQLLVSGPWP